MSYYPARPHQGYAPVSRNSYKDDNTVTLGNEKIFLSVLSPIGVTFRDTSPILGTVRNTYSGDVKPIHAGDHFIVKFETAKSNGVFIITQEALATEDASKVLVGELCFHDPKSKFAFWASKFFDLTEVEVPRGWYKRGVEQFLTEAYGVNDLSVVRHNFALENSKNGERNVPHWLLLRMLKFGTTLTDMFNITSKVKSAKTTMEFIRDVVAECALIRLKKAYTVSSEGV
jgi:hypothetical protein